MTSPAIILVLGLGSMLVFTRSYAFSIRNGPLIQQLGEPTGNRGYGFPPSPESIRRVSTAYFRSLRNAEALQRALLGIGKPIGSDSFRLRHDLGEEPARQNTLFDRLRRYYAQKIPKRRVAEIEMGLDKRYGSLFGKRVLRDSSSGFQFPMSRRNFREIRPEVDDSEDDEGFEDVLRGARQFKRYGSLFGKRVAPWAAKRSLSDMLSENQDSLLGELQTRMPLSWNKPKRKIFNPDMSDYILRHLDNDRDEPFLLK